MLTLLAVVIAHVVWGYVRESILSFEKRSIETEIILKSFFVGFFAFMSILPDLPVGLYVFTFTFMFGASFAVEYLAWKHFGSY